MYHEDIFYPFLHMFSTFDRKMVNVVENAECFPRKSAGSPAVPGRSPVSVLCAGLGFSILILSSCEITEDIQRQHWHTGHWPLCDIVRMLPLTGTRRKLGDGLSR